MEIIKQDPFYQKEMADYHITEVIPTKYDEDFACFIENTNRTSRKDKSEYRFQE